MAQRKYQQDWDWQESFYPQVADILRRNAMHIVSIQVAEAGMDIKNATDFIIQILGGNVAVRIRRGRYYYQYYDWTIRSRRLSGVETELHKLRQGFGDYYLYCWAIGNQIERWVLIDLHRTRELGILEQRYKEIANEDGTSWFIAIPIPHLQNLGVVCAISELVQESEVF